MAEVGNITVVDQKPIDKLPYDPNDIPDAVKKRAAAVDALYSNGSDGEQQPPSVPPEPAPVLHEQSPTPQASTPVPPTPTPAEPSSAPADEGDWKLRYERMH